MMKVEDLKHGRFYHLYNRGTDGCNLFRENENYNYFLSLYDKYISEVADTYAWVLMPNHFHFLVRIKEKAEIGFISPKTKPLSGNTTAERVDRKTSPSEVINPEEGFIPKKYKPEHQFSHLFNAYAQAFNKRYGRTGSLFQHPFKRKQIGHTKYLKHVILYIHNNPVHHGFCTHPCEYPWSSYLTCVSVKPTRLKRDAVLGWFDSDANFRDVHNAKVDIENIERWLDL